MVSALNVGLGRLKRSFGGFFAFHPDFTALEIDIFHIDRDDLSALQAQVVQEAQDTEVPRGLFRSLLLEQFDHLSDGFGARKTWGNIGDTLDIGNKINQVGLESEKPGQVFDHKRGGDGGDGKP